MSKRAVTSEINSVSRNLIRVPLISHPQCIFGSQAQLTDALGLFAPSLSIQQFGENDDNKGGFVNWIGDETVTCAYVDYGAPAVAECWQDDYYAVILLLSGRGKLQQYPASRQAHDRLFFVRPGADLYFQLSSRAPHLIFRIFPDKTSAPVLESFFSGDQERNPVFERRVEEFMRLLPRYLSHSVPFHERFGRLGRLRDCFLTMCRQAWAECSSLLPDAPGVPDRRISKVVRHLDTLRLDRYDLDYLCTLANMSPRGLYYAFGRQVGCTPYRYLLATRLLSVRLALILDDKDESRISLHAATEGFRHMSRFAAQYQQFFNEKPSETLIRREELQVGQPGPGVLQAS